MLVAPSSMTSAMTRIHVCERVGLAGPMRWTRSRCEFVSQSHGVVVDFGHWDEKVVCVECAHDSRVFRIAFRGVAFRRRGPARCPAHRDE